VIAGIIVWQVIYVIQIPDMDTDAYEHFIIARQILLAPKDLNLHWVWLPLYHYITAVAILLGANLTVIRFANIFLCSLIPVILFFYLNKKPKENTLFKALLASLICALSPIGIFMGTTAQPESLFVLSVILFCFLFEKEKYFIASVFLAIACMLRYEAWAILIIFTIYNLFIFVRNKKLKNAFNYKQLIILILPAIVISAWILLRWKNDGKFLSFLFDTKVFANDTLKEESSFSGGIMKFLNDLFFYPVWIPILFMGINYVFVPFGLLKTWRENKILVISGFSILIFITLSWILKSNLGLNRHFVSLIPVYAVLMANGVLFLASFFQNQIFFRLTEFRFLKFFTATRILIIILFITSAFYLSMWLSIWRNTFGIGYPEREEAAVYLNSLNPGKTIYCNDAIVEIFSNLDYKRFNHIWMDTTPNLSELLREEANKEGELYVVTSEDKIKNLNGTGKIVFESRVNPKTKFRVLIIKVTGERKPGSD
jgi:hypothetical protein